MVEISLGQAPGARLLRYAFDDLVQCPVSLMLMGSRSVRCGPNLLARTCDRMEEYHHTRSALLVLRYAYKLADYSPVCRSGFAIV